ncbi:MAG: 8-oxo-dGTP diphosphatase [Candidatus Saccharimonadales bacterium]
MRNCTLLFLRRSDEILLAMKKRGFGAGRWNGVGGKLDAGETIEQALVRESQEEIGVTPLDFRKVTVIDFYFPDGIGDQQVHVYFCDRWQGKPVESEEMAPQWFKLSKIPFDDMWQDDIVWLPQILKGHKLEASFTFDKDDNMLAAEFKIVDELKV